MKTVEGIIVQEMRYISISMDNTIKATLEGQQVHQQRVTQGNSQQSGTNQQTNNHLLQYISQNYEPPTTYTQQSINLPSVEDQSKEINQQNKQTNPKRKQPTHLYSQENQENIE